MGPFWHGVHGTWLGAHALRGQPGGPAWYLLGIAGSPRPILGHMKHGQGGPQGKSPRVGQKG